MSPAALARRPVPAAPSPTPQADPADDVVLIEGLLLHTVIGIHPDEAVQPQPLLLDLEIGVRGLPACHSDQIADTIDYSVVRERLLALAATHTLRLLEAFAQRVAELLISEFGAEWVRVQVRKPRKFPDMAACGVRLIRHRSAGGERRPLGLV